MTLGPCLVLCIEEYVGNISWLLLMKFINENIYWHGTGRISHSLNRRSLALLSCAQAIIMAIFFCKVKNLHLEADQWLNRKEWC